MEAFEFELERIYQGRSTLEKFIGTSLCNGVERNWYRFLVKRYYLFAKECLTYRSSPTVDKIATSNKQKTLHVLHQFITWDQLQFHKYTCFVCISHVGMANVKYLVSIAYMRFTWPTFGSFKQILSMLTIFMKTWETTFVSYCVHDFNTVQINNNTDVLYSDFPSYVIEKLRIYRVHSIIFSNHGTAILTFHSK